MYYGMVCMDHDGLPTISEAIFSQREKFTFKSRKLLANHWRKSNKREASIPMSELSE